MAKRQGRRTVIFENGVYVHSFAAVAGKKEGEGPMRDWFDQIFTDEYLRQDSFEKAESMLQKEALEMAMKKGDLKPENLNYVFAGDLLNQCIGSSFGIRDMGIPFVGMYGACSTMMLSLGMASTFVESGAAKLAAAVTSSHFCSSERQFRFPLEYGSQRPPTAQWTVTAAGCCIVSSKKSNLRINAYTAGEIVDLGITDANNMGAAMAPAAADTLLNFFKDTDTKPEDYDYVFTGDLGFVGSELFLELLARHGVTLNNHRDCGKLMFDRKKQDVHSGGSGCGCVGSLFCSYILESLKRGDWSKVLVMGTGALLSTVSAGQGESVPSIAHLVEIEKI